MRGLGCANALTRDCGSLKFRRTGHGFRLKEVRIGYLDRLDIVVRNDHARAARREMPESTCSRHRCDEPTNHRPLQPRKCAAAIGTADALAGFLLTISY